MSESQFTSLRDDKCPPHRLNEQGMGFLTGYEMLHDTGSPETGFRIEAEEDAGVAEVVREWELEPRPSPNYNWAALERVVTRLAERLTFHPAIADSD